MRPPRCCGESAAHCFSAKKHCGAKEGNVLPSTFDMYLVSALIYD